MNEAAAAKNSGRGGRTAVTGEKTRAAILDVAERLFAENGPSAVSTRAIASVAGVNTAALNYHFGSKDQLFEEMFQRRVAPINEQRLRLLESAISAAGCEASVSLEVVIRCFVLPPLRIDTGEAKGVAISVDQSRARIIGQFLARAFSSPGEEGFLVTYYEPVRSRFITVLAMLLPTLTTDELLRRYNFMVGALIYAMGGDSRLTRRPKSMATDLHNESSDGLSDTIDQLVAFLSAGFAAPSSRI